MTKQKKNVFRIVDANGNRATEGLRVVEDYARFVVEDSSISQRCKQLRHDLRKCLQSTVFDGAVTFRESNKDIGRSISTDSEYQRTSVHDIANANLARAQQAIRSLEEYAKILDPAVARQFEQIRYDAYQLQLSLAAFAMSVDRLANAALYVLVDAGSSQQVFRERIETLVAAGVDVVQLRDKQVSSRILLDRCELFREIRADASTLLIVNDRPDIACVASADGVHLGQDDMSVHDARTIVGQDMLIGVSTHSVEQVQSAISDGANYIGVGPTFESKTKSFTEFTGLDLLRVVSQLTALPAFAIGGISEDNIAKVLEAGFKRVAISGGVWLADNPAIALKNLRTSLTEAKSVREKVDG
jgi:thiamine-phosphate pyrophosphorylase